MYHVSDEEPVSSLIKASYYNPEMESIEVSLWESLKGDQEASPVQRLMGALIRNQGSQFPFRSRKELDEHSLYSVHKIENRSMIRMRSMVGIGMM